MPPREESPPLGETETSPPEPFDGLTVDADMALGKYVFRRVIGSGGMGTVVAAHDPDLDREVAVKLVSQAELNGHTRLLREAQAMARLSHPNVVGVHEVLRVDHRVAIVMDLVDGQDLARWRKGEVRSWQEVVAVYVQAARGLSAAHRAGLIHRDFKPSNVLIDRHGQVRVTDFGLVRTTEEAPPSDGGPTKPLDLTITDAAQRIGTPAYMAPEQHSGGHLDARTDQWAFACSLFEALYGRRPFEAASRELLASEVISGIIRHEPEESPVPREIRKAIRRALAPDPADRFPSMEALIAALTESGPARPTRRWPMLVGGGALLVITALAVAFGLARTGIEPVAAGAGKLLLVTPLASHEEWMGTVVADWLGTELAAGERLRVLPGDAVVATAQARGLRAQSREADVIALGGALAADFTISGRVVDDAGELRVLLQLRDRRTGAVLAEIGQTAPEADLSLTVASLGTELRALLGVPPLNEAEAELAARSRPKSLEATRAFGEGLGALRRYQAWGARVRFERALELEPNNPKFHAAMSRAYQALRFPQKAVESSERAFALSEGLPRAERMFIEARLHHVARRYDRASELYSALATFFPENLEYGMALAELLRDAGRGREALTTIDRLRAGAPRDALDARIDLLEASSAQALADRSRAEKAALAARAQGEAAGALDVIVRADSTLCWVHAGGDFERALTVCREVAQRSASLGDLGTTARAYRQLGYVHERRNELDEAVRFIEKSGALCEEIGDKSCVAGALLQLGQIAKTRAQVDLAFTQLEQARAVGEAIGDDDLVARAMTAIASVEQGRGRLEAARQAYLKGIELHRKLNADRWVAIAMQNLAWVEADLGDVIGARRHAEEAAVIQEQGKLDVDLVYSLDCAGLMALIQDDVATAERHLTRSLEMREARKMSTTATLQNLAELRLVQKRIPEARELIARSVATTKGGVTEGFARDAEARILLEAGDLDGAERANARARELTREDIASGLDVNQARILTRRGKPRQAMVFAQRALALAEKQGAVSRRLDAEGALGEAELALGLPAGRERLERAARDAAARGFVLTSRLFLEIVARRR